MENYNKKFLSLWKKFENSISVNNEQTTYEIIEHDERFFNKRKLWHTYRDFRNVLTHGDRVNDNDIAEMTKEAYEQFTKMTDKIINPKRASNICIKDVYKAKDDTSLNAVLETMKQNDFSNVPVVDKDNHVIGVFSHYTLFLYFGNNSEVIVEPQKTKIDMFKKYYTIGMNNETAYKFIAKNTNINEIIDLFTQNKNEKKHLGALLVTANGNKNEPLAGIITKDDILEYFD